MTGVVGSVMQKIFGSPVPPAPPGNINQPPVVQPLANGVTEPNGVVPNTAGATNTTANQNEPDPKSPEVKFKGLWEPPKPEDGNTSTKSAEIDPQKIMEAASKVDFSKVLDQENLQAIT